MRILFEDDEAAALGIAEISGDFQQFKCDLELVGKDIQLGTGYQILITGRNAKVKAAE